MTTQTFEAADYVFTIVRRTEESLRSFITEHMIQHYGGAWVEHLPGELTHPPQFEGDPFASLVSTDDVWHRSYFRHLTETIDSNWRAVFRSLSNDLDRKDVIDPLHSINRVRNQAYHCKPISEHDLLRLVADAGSVALWLRDFGIDLHAFVDAFMEDRIAYLIKSPRRRDDGLGSSFFNVPDDDFELIGRRGEMSRLENYLRGRDAVVTIAGRGGVGKTAIATHLVHKLWNEPPDQRLFKAVIWVTAKNTALTMDGIEEFEAPLSTYEQLIADIFNVLSGDEWRDRPLEDLEQDVDFLLSIEGTPVLIVIDNLETIFNDVRIIDFIKDIPSPSKVLITSRLGIGEVERRVVLAGLGVSDARRLARATAQDLSTELTDSITQLENSVLDNWIKPVDGVAVAIKWMVAQIALGKSFENVQAQAAAPDSDLVQFLFRDVYNLLTPTARMMLCVLSVFGDQAPTDGLWRMVSGLDQSAFDDGKRQLVLASMITTSIENNTSRWHLAGMSETFAMAEFENLETVKDEARRRFRQFMDAAGFASQDAVTRGRWNYRAARAYRMARNSEETVATVYTNEGYSLWDDREDLEAARTKFRDALSVVPKFYFTYKTWAEVEDKAGNYERSQLLMQEALDIDPHNPQVYTDWANILRYSQSRPQQSQITELLESAYQLAPTDMQIVHMYADSVRRNRDFEKAEQLLSTLGLDIPTSDHPDHSPRWFKSRVDLYNSWGIDLNQNRNFDAALEKLQKSRIYIEHALSAWPVDRNMVFADKNNKLSYGIALGRSGNPIAALVYLNEALWEQSTLATLEKRHNARVELARARTLRHHDIRDRQAAAAAAQRGLAYVDGSDDRRDVALARRLQSVLDEM